MALNYSQPHINGQKSFEASLSLNRLYLYNDDYLSSPNSWQSGDIMTFDLDIEKRRNYNRIATEYNVHLMTAAPGSDFKFNRLTLAIDFTGKISRYSTILASVMHGYSEGDIPVSHLFSYAQVSPIEYYQNRWYSARGTLPEVWRDDGRLFIDDGVSMPGYLNQNKTGRKKLAARIELGLVNPVVFFELPRNFITDELAKITNSIYMNHGAVWDEAGMPGSDDFEAEGGFHFTYKLPYWERVFGDELIHLYLPLAVSSPYGEEDSFKFRWALMIGP